MLEKFRLVYSLKLLNKKLYKKAHNAVKKLGILIIIACMTNLLVMAYMKRLHANSSIDLKFDNNNLEITDVALRECILFTSIDEDKLTNNKLSFIQEHFYTCGPAALKYLLFSYGIELSEKELMICSGTTEAGTSMYGIKKAVQGYGLDGDGFEMSLAKLKKIREPVIAFINDNHYVVIRKIDQYYVYLFDPSPQCGFKKITINEFLSSWSGVVFKVSTMPISRVVY